MKKTIATVAVCAIAAVGAATNAHADEHGPTCSPMWDNHGQHVTGDYMDPPGLDPSRDERVGRDGTEPAAPASTPEARGGPAHLTSAPAPGASFCLDQANSPGWPHE